MIRRPPRSPPFPYTPLFRSPRRRSVTRSYVCADDTASARHCHGQSRTPKGTRTVVRPPSASTVTGRQVGRWTRSEEHTSELQSRQYLVCRLLLEKKKSSILY